MARRPRIVIEGALYHVYNRVSSEEDIFADPEEAIELVEIVRDIKKRDGWTIFAWCVMSNQFHVVLRTSFVPLWRGMHGIQNRFSRGFNRRHGRTGSLWQGRYKTKYVEDQSYLDGLVLYVHLNPVNGGLEAKEFIRRVCELAGFGQISLPRGRQTEIPPMPVKWSLRLASSAGARRGPIWPPC
jgi:putative transposase